MRIIFMITFCGILSANICQNVTPNLYGVVVDYARDVGTFVGVLPAGASNPDTAKAEEVLAIVKSMEAKCKNMVDHKDPAVADAKKALEIVKANDVLLQKSGPFTEKGLMEAQKKAVDASTKLMALLSEFPQPVAAKASTASPKNNDDEGDDDEDDDEGDDDEDDDEDEDDDSDDEDEA